MGQIFGVKCQGPRKESLPNFRAQPSGIGVCCNFLGEGDEETPLPEHSSEIGG